MSEEKKEVLQKKFMEYQMLEQQVKQFQEQMETVEKQLGSLQEVKEALDELSTVKEGTDLLVPVSSGIFLKAKTQSTDKVLVNVGAETAVEKTLPEAKILLEEQEKELLTFKKNVGTNLEGMSVHMQKMQDELQKLVAE
jgi:prefoldin alpha subunit